MAGDRGGQGRGRRADGFRLDRRQIVHDGGDDPDPLHPVMRRVQDLEHPVSQRRKDDPLRNFRPVGRKAEFARRSRKRGRAIGKRRMDDEIAMARQKRGKFDMISAMAPEAVAENDDALRLPFSGISADERQARIPVLDLETDGADGAGFSRPILCIHCLSSLSLRSPRRCAMRRSRPPKCRSPAARLQCRRRVRAAAHARSPPRHWRGNSSRVRGSARHGLRS